MAESKIEWTEHVWNPVTGCAKVSQGCKNCYALREWPRLSAPRPQPNVYTGRAFTDVMCHPERLAQPLHWSKPRRIFVNSMSDLFHEAVPDDFILAVLGITQSPSGRHHTYQVLTKRPARMLEFFRTFHRDQPPFPNVWLGVSVEDQATADERIPLLLQTPAAVRFISAEPLLGPVDLAPKADYTYRLLSEWYGPNGFDETGSQPRIERMRGYFPKLDWVIAGGESGPKARPSHPDWFRSLRDQGVAAGVPFFFKQWGEWAPSSDRGGHILASPAQIEHEDSRWGMRRFGKRTCGRLLDGRTWDEYPQ